MGYIGAGITRFNTADELTVTGDAQIDTTTLVVDSTNNRVGVGTATPAQNLHIENTSASVRQRFVTGTSNQVSIDFGDTDSGTVGRIEYDHATNAMAFRTNSSERLRIDSSGNLLVGKTATGLSTTGFQALATGNQSAFISDGDRALILNRKTSDGSIQEFRKDGTAVGNIGTDSGDLTIYGDVGIRFSGDDVRPLNSSGSQADNAVDLGHHDVRWQDLYLSGGAYLGGTGSANHLDDYEEGTFTATVSPQTSGTITLSSSFDLLSYTKVGRLVTISGGISVSSVSSPVGGFVLLSGLPFTSLDGGEISGRNAGSISFFDSSVGGAATTTAKGTLMLESATQIRIYVDASTVAANDQFHCSFSYIT